MEIAVLINTYRKAETDLRDGLISFFRGVAATNPNFEIEEHYVTDKRNMLRFCDISNDADTEELLEEYKYFKAKETFKDKGCK